MKTDAQLIREARDDPDAFAELYLRHRTALYRWLRTRATEPVAAELTAETFAQAALGLKRFRDEADGSAAPWLFGIAKNLVRRFYEAQRVETRARKRLGMPVSSYDLDLDELDDRADAAGLEPALASAVGDLPAGQREALELRVLQERDYRDVAASLGVSEVAARLRVMRALGALSRRLKGVTP
jgi:RNA polymerase sigma-70 factor (ECF subfamily)